MSASATRWGGLALTLGLFLALSARPAAAPLSDIESRGKRLYFFGTDASSLEPTALLGRDSTRAPARLAPCASCHGDDGAGRPEGAIIPPSISWRHLTNVPASNSGDRPRAPFSEENFRQAVSSGEDASGRRLDDIMPRYAFSPDQLRALVAYLKVIEADQAPGVSGDTVRIAAILPERLSSSTSDLMRQVLSAYAADINARGGIFNRRLQFVMLDAADAAERLAAFVHDREILAVLVTESDARAHEIERIVEDAPVISLVDLPAGAGRNTTHTKFALFANDATQIRVMIDFVAQLSPGRPMQFATLFPDGAEPIGARNAVARQNMSRQGPPPIERAYDAARFDAGAIVAALSARGVDAVVFLGDGAQLAMLVTALKDAHWRPYLLIPGGAASAALFDAPKDIADKILLAFPMIAADASRSASFVALQRDNAIPGHHAAAQVAVYCAAQLLAQGLKLAGRELTREKFVTALESLREYDTGLIRPITLGPNQHVGSYGAYIFGVQAEEKRLTIMNDWKAPQ